MLGWLARLFRPAAPVWIETGELRRRLASPVAPLVVDVRGRDEFTGRSAISTAPATSRSPNCRRIGANWRPPAGRSSSSA